MINIINKTLVYHSFLSMTKITTLIACNAKSD